MSIGSRMRERREELGITQPELADMLGITKGAVSNYETGANTPKAAMMYKIFKVLKCDANFLYQDYLEESKSTMLPPEERRVLHLYRELNAEGKEKLIDYADDLVQSRKYIKSSPHVLDEESKKGGISDVV